jgi:alkanesulfonate monooxygenase SsuD/methylene tetrahydromethanopterin reductase-like flavin-dependent oxidoreductase (luciferase family)
MCSDQFDTTKEASMDLGIYSFGDRHPDPFTGVQVSVADQYANTLERMKLADELGLSFYGLGEHHLDTYAISNPGTVLAAAASITKQITLASAVTVLSTEDPVRVYQQFTTLDQLSRGRAELLAGRGSFIESFPLFGANLDDYEELYEEKLDLLLAARRRDRVAPPLPRPLADLDRDRRESAVVDAGRCARTAHRVCRHRRSAGTLRPPREPVPQVRHRSRA